MAAKAWATRDRAIDEVFFRNDAVSLCLLINRRAKTMRVVDFRAGPSNAKRMFVLSLAQREGVDKIYTLVERDEVSTWVKLGFKKEGNIPGFYKRSDAFMLGSTVAQAIADSRTRPKDGSMPETPPESEMRLVAFDAPAEGAAVDPAHALMEKTIVHAKKIAKDLAARPMPVAKVSHLEEVDAKKAVAAALKANRALTAFEPFGRDVERAYYAVTSRGGFELVASMETQSCFGNAFLELLTGPRNEAEKLATVSALRALCDKFLAEGVVSAFSMTPSDDLGLATAYVANGFRRTGLLESHLVVGNERKDAIIWARKLANPTDD